MKPVFFTDRDLGKLFPAILAASGMDVERHADHFAHDAPDSEWLATVGGRGWIAVSHNVRIRYTPNELAAVRDNQVALLIVVGKAPLRDLAENFVRLKDRVEVFLQKHRPPFIAKVYRAPPARAPARETGRIEMWWPEAGA